MLGNHQTHVSNALWLTPGSDKAQRDLLRTAVEWADGVRPAHRDRLEWALDQADKLSTYRNDIVHGYPGYLLWLDGVNVHVSSEQSSIKRVMKHVRIDTPFHELVAALCDDSNASIFSSPKSGGGCGQSMGCPSPRPDVP